MCTIGTIINNHTNISFKQCDLEVLTDFIQPEICNGSGDILYLPFTRTGSKGAWAGVNNFGVSFVAADSYLAKNGLLTSVDQDIFAAYTKIISQYKTAKDAAEYMVSFYKTFMQPDILLISDAQSSYFIEANQGSVECIERKQGHFASTNHFRILPDAVDYQQNHSTYLRLQRAESILEHTPTNSGVFNVLSDQYFGKTVLSVCRVNEQTPVQEAPYFTQATAIFYADGKTVSCAYQLNGNPNTNFYTVINDVFGQSKTTFDLNKEQASKALIQ
ncbi:carcinine hydrolase/isopenicillin-N N-acyltransferase family protein [Pseudoalteromonas denitrificans]|uniref:Acyl-coenzyme A:6-aminopenicillanic acid acyl-transferase n=1 Tax=Pseudoalteromonas denitrificans DSM 6059 TaxID=1123010 RepID=A0A1I1G840_9GAMM|nr:carcinine hydrolase/isopenicillin-N N-acyltransferase family protein [Pseudoalteromonas denitrificans]SFC07502.1 Acyl-coenzyme A:6-aminopenicillanic acid acyl-transferase [Pseudoalteromonas denitrificans DSM 6059]